MICKHITQRSYQLKPYIWCRKLKKKITWDDCNNCVEIEPRENKGILKRTPLKKSDKSIKKKSNKLAKLERNRFSILTDDLDHCYICEIRKLREVPKDDLHEIWEGRNRQICMRYGFVAPLCRACHEDKEIKEYLKQLCMAKAKEKYSEEELKELLK